MDDIYVLCCVIIFVKLFKHCIMKACLPQNAFTRYCLRNAKIELAQFPVTAFGGPQADYSQARRFSCFFLLLQRMVVGSEQELCQNCFLWRFE